MTRPSATAPDEDSREKITPFIESAILELALLTVKLVTTPFAVLFCTRDFRNQMEAFRRDEVNARYSPTVARPLSFYVLWMAIHFLLANSYWNYVSREHPQFGDIAKASDQVKKAAAFLKSENWSDITGRVEALIMIAFAVTLIIAVKAALVTLIARSIKCQVRFVTALFASAYAVGTLIFFQYAFIFSHHSFDMILGNSQSQAAGYYILIYGSLLICIVLTVRVNRMIQTVDETPETPTFVSWFIGTLIWLYLIIVASRFVLDTPVSLGQFGRIFVNAFIPGIAL